MFTESCICEENGRGVWKGCQLRWLGLQSDEYQAPIVRNDHVAMYYSWLSVAANTSP